MRIARTLVVVLLTGCMALAFAGALAAQEAQLPGQQLAQQSLRPYWHVFIAYAIAIILLGAWAGSIARRLSEVERRLGK